MTDTEQMTIQEFIEKYDVEMEFEEVSSRPDGLMDDNWKARHYRCTLTQRSYHNKMEVYFSVGLAHSEPKLEDILDCMASDSAGYENAWSFEDWANEYGYDPDSRKDERIYNACAKQAEELNAWLRDEAYHDLLWNTMRE